MVPNFTALAPLNPVPVMVTEVDPEVGPLVGLTPPTVGGPMKVNWSTPEVAEVPPAVVTVVSTVPAPSAGVAAVIWVGELTENASRRRCRTSRRWPR